MGVTNCPGSRPLAAPGGQEAPVRAELLDAVVAGIGDVEGAVRGEGDRRLVVAAPAERGEVELPLAGAGRAPRLEEGCRPGRRSGTGRGRRPPPRWSRPGRRRGGRDSRAGRSGSPRVSHRNSTGPAGGVASWARARPSRLPRTRAAPTAAARPTTERRLRPDNGSVGWWFMQILRAPCAVSGQRRRAVELANPPSAVTPPGYGPSVAKPDADASTISVFLTASAGQSRQEPIMPRARGQNIGMRYGISGGQQQAGTRYT